jgi:hypothetical protein
MSIGDLILIWLTTITGEPTSHLAFRLLVWTQIFCLLYCLDRIITAVLDLVRQ